MQSKIQYENETLTIPHSLMVDVMTELKDIHIALKGIEDQCDLIEEVNLNELKDRAKSPEEICETEEFKILLKSDKLCETGPIELLNKINKSIKKYENECTLSTNKFITNFPDQIIEFRILDGTLYPYHEECVGGIESCINSSKGSLQQKTMYGSLTIEENLNPNLLRSSYKLSRTFKINKLKGNNRILYLDELGNFHDLFAKAFNAGEDLVIKVSKKLFKLINLISIEAQAEAKLTPMKFELDKKTMENLFTASQETSKTYIKPSSLSVRYKITKEQYKCASKIIEIDRSLETESNSQNIVDASGTTTNVVDINGSTNSSSTNISTTAVFKLNTKSTENIATYLSSISTEDYQICEYPSTPYYISISLPNDFAQELINKMIKHFHLKTTDISFHETMEIMLDNESKLKTDDEINLGIEDNFLNILTLKGGAFIYGDKMSLITKEQNMELKASCAITLGYSGTLVAAEESVA